MNNVITASRSGTINRCARQHYWRYEVGLCKDSAALPLRFGSSWANALEAVYRGANYDKALQVAIPEGVDLDAYECAKVGALLFCYLRRWEHAHHLDGYTVHKPEQQFSEQLLGEWTAEGKLDLLADSTDRDDCVMIESKTTASKLSPDSDFWLRLRFNFQVLQYVTWLHNTGREVRKVIYDVTRKPSIRPKMVPTLDDDGKKIVVNQKGQRVFNLAGKNKGEPRQSPDKEKGYTVQEHFETPQEYSLRLRDDILSRPDFYFARKEVAVCDQDLKEFKRHRLEVLHLIMHYRSRQWQLTSAGSAPESAWPKALNDMVCRSCQFKDFCLTGLSVDAENPPTGYSVKPFNPELEKHDDTDSTEDTSE